MTTIADENAKQIRASMNVLVRVYPLDGIDLTYGGTTSGWYVSDGVLSEPFWAMRKLADLQKNGFPLDGSCALYDPNVNASRNTGKIGVRGNTGQSVTVTITAASRLSSVSVFAAGAEALTFGSRTYSFQNEKAEVKVNATTATFVINPAGNTVRIEVAEILAGAVIDLANDNLISCTASLRSDLSIFNPTMPQSELNVRAYSPEDISEKVADIPEGTPVLYSAGYEGDMSQRREFYVTGQVSWHNYELSFSAVDASANLERDASPFFVDGTKKLYGYFCGILDGLYVAFVDLIAAADIPVIAEDAPGDTVSKGYVLGPLSDYSSLSQSTSVFERKPARDYVAKFMQLCHQEIPDTIDDCGAFWPVFVDAGIPTVTWQKPSASKWTIYEEDCADLKRSIERSVARVSYDSVRMPYVDETPVSDASDVTDEFYITSGQDFTFYMNSVESIENLTIFVYVGEGNAYDGWAMLNGSDSRWAGTYWDMPKSGIAEDILGKVTTTPRVYGQVTPDNEVHVTWNSYLTQWWNNINSIWRCDHKKGSGS